MKSGRPLHTGRPEERSEREHALSGLKWSPNRTTILHILGLVFLAILFYAPGYNYTIPVYHNDEALFLQETLIRYDKIDSERHLPGYPPGLLMAYDVSYRISQVINENFLQTNPHLPIHNLRLISIFLNIGTAILLYSIGRSLGNTTIGFMAAGAWLTMPYVAFRTLVALIEPWQAFLFALSLFCVVRAMQKDRPQWAVAALCTGLISVAFKYSEYPMLGLSVGITCLQIIYHRKKPEARRSWIIALIIEAFLIIIGAFILLFVYDSISLIDNPEPAAFLTNGPERLFDLQLIGDIFTGSIHRLGVDWFIFVPVILIGGGLYLRQAQRWQQVTYLITLLIWVVNTYLIVTYVVYVAEGRIKYTIPLTSLSMILFVVALYGIYKYFRQKFPYAGGIVVLSLAIIIIWLGPMAYYQTQLTYSRAQPATTTILRDWASATISRTGTVYITADITGNVFTQFNGQRIPWLMYEDVPSMQWRLFDTIWGGYTGRLVTWVNRETAGDFSDRSLQEWQDMHVYYLLADLHEPVSDSYLPLRTFPAPDEVRDFRGAEMIIYRLWDMEHAVQVTFASDIHLTGYDLQTEAIDTGTRLHFTPYWQASQQPAIDYQMYVHLVPLDTREVIAQADIPPARGMRPTTTWAIPSETLIGSTVTLEVPAGEYRLVIGLYDLQTGERLLTRDGDDFVLIDVVPAADN